MSNALAHDEGDVAASRPEETPLARARTLLAERQSIPGGIRREGGPTARTSAELFQTLEELVDAASSQEARLKASLDERDFYQSLFRQNPRALVVTSPRGMIREVSDSAATLIRVPRRFLEGRALIGFVARGACRAFRGLLGATTGNDRRHSDELTLRLRNGGGMVPVRAQVSACESGSLVLWELDAPAEPSLPIP